MLFDHSSQNFFLFPSRFIHITLQVAKLDISPGSLQSPTATSHEPQEYVNDITLASNPCNILVVIPLGHVDRSVNRLEHVLLVMEITKWWRQILAGFQKLVSGNLGLFQMVLPAGVEPATTGFRDPRSAN